MPRKPITDSGKREEILSAALDLFLANGYEKTSIRMISQKIGCEVGLVYYYFKTKDDVFENALALYFTQTENELKALMETKETNVEKIIENFADYIKEKAENYRAAFSENAHITIRAAVREKITALSEAYLSDALTAAGKKDASVLAIFLAGGLCSAALRDDASYFETNGADTIRTAKALLGAETKENTGKKREIPSFLL
ncbi:MAG: TetR/AcrR family transcriptional regulator [Clostridia bacterium]|nr:TetR/AcrR family transcriptional regulator [Clostridia bacterium]